MQVLFACAEALYAHGYSNEACRLAVELARDLLANPPDLKVEQPQTKVVSHSSLSSLHQCQSQLISVISLLLLPHGEWFEAVTPTAMKQLLIKVCEKLFNFFKYLPLWHTFT